MYIFSLLLYGSAMHLYSRRHRILTSRLVPSVPVYPASSRPGLGFGGGPVVCTSQFSKNYNIFLSITHHLPAFIVHKTHFFMQETYCAQVSAKYTFPQDVTLAIIPAKTHDYAIPGLTVCGKMHRET